jgi:hypothetical protein
MSIEQEIRDQIERNKELKQEVGYINNHLSILEGFCREDKQKQIDDAYNRGLENAWNVARKLAVETDDGGVSISDLYKMFGIESMCMIMKNNTVYDAIDKLKAYEDKRKDSIEVGDEVIDRDGDITIVTNIHERLFDGLCNDGSTMGDLFLEDVRKTGRHFDHIDKLLEAMRK